jgi:hypothetical protein
MSTLADTVLGALIRWAGEAADLDDCREAAAVVTASIEAHFAARVQEARAEAIAQHVRSRGCDDTPALRERLAVERVLMLDAVADEIRAEALREAADVLAVDSSLTDCTRRDTEYADARDDERVDIVDWLRERADETGPRHA